jgi:hypothetical protein
MPNPGEPAMTPPGQPDTNDAQRRRRTLKNAELRAERAIQQKLDAIASSLLEDKRGDAGDADQQLETAIGIHDEI